MFDEATIKRFWSKVSVGSQDECWEWQACKNRGGYGKIMLERGPVLAHRAAWAIANCSEIPQGMVIRHKCDNPTCCNPAHLILGTQYENMLDAKERGRMARGHRNKLAKLSEDDVLEIRRLRKAGYMHTQLAEMFGVADNTICSITTGYTWAWLEDEE